MINHALDLNFSDQTPDFKIKSNRRKSLSFIKETFQNHFGFGNKRKSQEFFESDYIPRANSENVRNRLIDSSDDENELFEIKSDGSGDNCQNSNNAPLIKNFQQHILQRVGTIELEKSSKIKVSLPNFFSEEIKKEVELKVVVCTFNVAESISDTVGTWIISHPADIYAIGLQEVDMSASTLVKNTSDALKLWDDHFETCFENEHFKNYKKVSSQQFVGMYHAIYIHKDHYEHLSECHWSKIGLGQLGLGNKVL
jgi:hypothetical protein